MHYLHLSFFYTSVSIYLILHLFPFLSLTLLSPHFIFYISIYLSLHLLPLSGTGKTYSLFGRYHNPVRTGPESARKYRRDPNSLSSRRGKSFLDIEGAEDGQQEQSVICDNTGMIPRILYDIIEGMQRQDIEANEGDMKITFSFLEIYNEKIRDLLIAPEDDIISPTEAFSTTPTSQPATLKVREHPVFGPYVEGLTKPVVFTAEEALSLLSIGLSRRTTTHTAWNAHSSRSHAVVTLEISQAGKYAVNASFNQSIDTKRSLFSPTVSFTHSIKPSGNHLSPDCSSIYNHDTSINSSIVAHDPETDNRHFVRVQLVDLAGSEKDPMQPGKVHREGDEMDLITPTASKSGKKSNFSQPNSTRNNMSSSHGHSSEVFGGSGNGTPTSNTIEMRMIRRSLSTLGYIIKALGKSFIHFISIAALLSISLLFSISYFSKSKDFATPCFLITSLCIEFLPANIFLLHFSIFLKSALLGRGEAFKSLPYRDSVLTWLLRDALSGRNHTTMLVGRCLYYHYFLN